MDDELSPEEYAIWQAIWRCPEIRRKYHIGIHGRPTYDELARLLGLSSRESVRRIELIAISKIRRALKDILTHAKEK